MATIQGDEFILVGTDLADLLIERDPPFPGQNLAGLQGDDTYLLLSLDSFVQEDAGAGTDTIRLAVDFIPGGGDMELTLPFAVENFEVQVDPSGPPENERGVAVNGNELQNRITTGAGDDSIDGGLGIDRMAGLGGDDFYVVDNAGDIVEEVVPGFNPEGLPANLANGNDTVVALVTYTLAANVENLILSGFVPNTSFDGTGNALDNDIDGNSGDNGLRGLAGNDLISGGQGDDTIDGGEGNDFLGGGFGDDSVLGGAGADRLDGGDGRDTLAGGAGDDAYVEVDAGDTLVELPGGGYDRVEAFADWTLAANFEHLQLFGNAVVGTGNSTGNAIDGNGLNNLLSGLEGNDRLDGKAGADTMLGGLGNDTFVLDSAGDRIVERAGEGTDWAVVTLSGDLGVFALAPNVENLLLTQFEGAVWPSYYFVAGNDLNNRIIGSGGFEIINGAGGDDLIESGGSGDSLQGGRGNDTFIVYDDNTGVVELANEGIDKVLSWVDIRKLANNIENATLLTADGGQLRGNNLNNRLEGGAGDDFIDGLGGNDTLAGGAGDDAYIVNGLTPDVVQETAGGGIDTVFSFIDTYTLADHVEELYLGGAGDGVRGTGNALDNFMQGNARANVLDGRGGNDTLFGLGGNDSLIGGAGNDLLDGGSGTQDTTAGGAGNDTYIVGSSTDVVNETVADGGVDEVRAGASFTLATPNAAGVENLTLTGAALNGTGNGLANRLVGNDADNTLEGGAGDDTFVGSNDTVPGLNDDTLNGGGSDTFVGGAGNDVYFVDSVGDVVTETAAGAAGGTDTVRSVVGFELGDNLENLVLLGDADADGAGNGLANRITGNIGNNLLQGGLGNDTLAGGKGNDDYVIEGANDSVSEISGEGIDRIFLAPAAVPAAGLTFKLPDQIEGVDIQDGNFVDDPTLLIHLDGNALGNYMVGNDASNRIKGLDGNDILEGGVGADTIEGGAGDDLFSGEEVADGAADSLIGGLGNDIYQLDNVGDVVVELAGQGIDTVIVGGNILAYNAAVKAAAVENFVLFDLNDEDGNFATPLDIAFIGNGLDNSIAGNHGDSSVDAAGGDDTIRFTAVELDIAPWAALVEAFMPGASIRREGITLDQNDTVNGGTGTDTLFAELVDQSDTLNITGVELVHLFSGTLGEGSNTVATGGFTQLQRITVSDSDENTAANISLTGLAAGVTVGAADFTQQLTLAFANATGESDSIDVVLRNVDLNLVTAGIERLMLDVGDFSPREDFGPMRIDLSDATGLEGVALTGRDNIALDLPDVGGVGPDLLLKDLHADVRLVSDELVPTLTDLTVRVSNVNAAIYSGDFAFGSNQAGPTLTQLTIDTTPEGDGPVPPGAVTNTLYVASLTVDRILVQGTAELELHIAGQVVDAGALEGELYLFSDAQGGAIDVTGGQGFDRIFGSDGDDRLNAGAGGGDLQGRDGDDVFVFDRTPGEVAGVTYFDFESGDDTIELDAAIFTGLATLGGGELSGDAFFTGDPGDVQTANQKIIFDPLGGGMLYYDADGNGAGVAVAFGSVWFNGDVVASDIVVVASAPG